MEKYELQLSVSSLTTGSIVWNFEEAKAAIEKQMSVYKSLVYTEETIAQAKTDRLEIAAKRKELEKIQAEVRDRYQAPYNEFYSQYKQLKALYENAEKNIKSYEDAYKSQQDKAKKEDAEKYWNDHGVTTFEVPFEKVWKYEYLLKKWTLKKMHEDLDATKAKIDGELTIISHLPAEQMNYVLPQYLDSFNLSESMAAWDRLKANEARAQEALKAAQEAKAQRETMNHREEKETPANVSETVPAEAKEPTYTITFTVMGNREQMNSLSEFMNKNHIAFKVRERSIS